MYMGTLEEKSRKHAKRKNIQKLILETVIVSGALSATFIAPNIIGAMKKLNLLPGKRQTESINSARNRMVKKGWLTRDTQGFLHVTKRGKDMLLKMQVSEHGLPKPKRWDGKWRVLIFDIPNYRRGLRAKLRRSLQCAGFKLLQGSVWIYPYNCEDYVALLKADFKIGKDMRYLIADTIEGDGVYRKTFGLT